MLLLISVVAIALVARSAASESGNEALISLTVIGVAAFTTLVLIFLDTGVKNSIIFGVNASAFVLFMHIIECLLQTKTTEYAWRYISGDIYLIVAPVILIGSAIASAVSAFVGTFLHRLVNGTTTD